MNWYKQAQLRDITDRNDINKKIRDLKEVVTTLDRISDYVFQNAAGAKRKLKEIASSKILSSYPKIKEIIEYADKKSLDNYKETSENCKSAMDILYKKIKDLEKEREDFVQKKLPELMKMRTKKKEDKK